MFSEPGSEFIGSWASFIVIAVILMGALYILNQFAGTKGGKKTVNSTRKIILFIAYPFYKLRSMLPHRGREAFDGFLLLLYCVGAGLLIIYAAQ